MKKLTIFFSILFIVTSCDDYLDVEPKGRVVPSTIEDYDQLLTGGSYNMHTVQNEEVLGYTGNDFKFQPNGDVTNPNNQSFQLFSYGNLRFYNPSTVVPAWNNAYANIYIYNKVINEIQDATLSVGYNVSEKDRIIAEAKYGRALDYFYLVNTFAKHYSPDNVASDGVPIVLEANVNQKVGKRNSVGEVYDLVISDLQAAIPQLPDNSVSVTRPNKAAGYALLARVNLYKGDFDSAVENATNALGLNGELSNYISAEDLRGAYEREQYTNRYFGGAAGLYSTPNDDFKAQIDTVKDTRYSKFFAFYPGYGVYQQTFIWYNQAPSIGEMYVTRAEANARLGNLTEAIDDLNTLRNHRVIDNELFKVNDFSSITDLVRFILEERRREVLFTLTNLFDLKRRNLDSELAKTTVHEFDGTQYIAEPNSGKLVLPIPASVMKFHTDWSQN